MHLRPLRPLFERQGDLLTVFLESRPPSEDAPEQVRKRWKALREQAEQAGAEEPVLDAAEATLVEAKAGELQADGRVIVAAAEEGESGGASVLLEEPWDSATGPGDTVHWGALPEVGDLVREELSSVRILLAVADQEGARVRHEVVTQEREAQQLEATTVEGDSVEGAHKPRGGALAHNRIQRRADEAVKQNAQVLADHLTSAARTFAPRVLVLAGEVQGRTAIRSELSSKLADICVETDEGGVQDDGAEQALAEELRRVAGEETMRSQAVYTDQFHESGAHGLAVQGASPVSHAAQMGAVATLLLQPGRAAADESLLLKACALTDAEVAFVDAATHLEDGVGALLRFPPEGSTPPQ
ncbi:MAG TPA: hypothetical protein VJ976_08050 [Ornithinimicrobium sp.]|uniref:baeRF2 domain-containing protein n=1 Tax=Ornithinimicrobium sp. TaxID=1977084 RepID=UPI002B47623F|nr:hypothetical protein [Ornithinimicrobium sp.]HKJ12325.1 hypothetical protein [Ornithinimicrobium sp.]